MQHLREKIDDYEAQLEDCKSELEKVNKVRDVYGVKMHTVKPLLHLDEQGCTWKMGTSYKASWKMGSMATKESFASCIYRR